MKLARKDILGIRDLTVEEINLILDTAESFIEVSTREIKKVPTLRGVTVLNLFYEPSTRTRTSFEIAAKRLSADTINISTATSSVVKGETFVDTAKNLEAMNPDIIVLRHSAAGAPHMLSRIVRQCVINAGDGAHEHPTQALLDMMTIREKKKRIAGLKVSIVGDIAHSRVARSNIYGLIKMGAKVTVGGPSTMMPRFIDRLGVEVHHHVNDAIRDADIIMMLRIQTERQDMSVFPSLREYANLFGLNRKRVALAKDDVIIMHPGPMNRGVEISPDVADGP
jgi:aspartate carbamoyltransferase catalytic subunit